MKIALVLSAFFVLIAVEARDYHMREPLDIKQEYCGNRDYVGNSGKLYPHLHCGEKSLTLYRSRSDYINLHGQYATLKRVLEHADYYYGQANNKQTITAVLERYEKDGCRTI